jgi:predicted transcriptional regulator
LKKGMPNTSDLDVRVEQDVEKRIRALAAERGQSVSEAASEALRAYIAHDAWIRGRSEEAIREADAGEFATPDEVEAVFRKWRG